MPDIDWPDLPSPDVNTFVIHSGDPEITFRAHFGDGAPTVIDGYGGWTVTSRPKDVGITEWMGRNPIAVEIPFTIDRWLYESDERGIETERYAKRLERLAGIGSDDEPPICSVNGQGVIPHDETNAPDKHRWVIENINWERSVELRSGSTQRRLRCGGTIIIRKFVKSDPLERRRRANKKKKKKGDDRKRPKYYVVKQGDTLTSIAAKKQIYGDASKWKKIADANNIRDPRSLREGQRLRIP